MLEVRGKYGSAKIFTDLVEQAALSQVMELLNEPFTAGQTVRMMPDIHAGKGCTVGTTMTITDKVVPNLVGVDIGCGVIVGKLNGVKSIDFEMLDKLIRDKVPSGMNVHKNYPKKSMKILENLRCKQTINFLRAERSIGTLGGGNHFIEVAQGTSGDYYLLIHTGSRSLGLSVAKYYQDLAIKQLTDAKPAIDAMVEKLKKEGRTQEISGEIAKIKANFPSINRDLAYLEGQSKEDYLHDLHIAQEYANANREAILSIIAKGMKWKDISTFTTMHNYIEVETGILRKGAVSAKAGEPLVIPMNMRDGSLLCTGKGNPDWNYSAPHGAGRILSRSRAKSQLSMEEFQESMKGIFTTSVSLETLDESPMAYKPMESILENLGDAVEVNEIIKPVYNFKASN